MKFKLFFILSILLSSHAFAQSYDKNGYRINIKYPAKAGSTIHLAQYYQGQTYTVDSTRFSSSGIAVFNLKDKLADGQYLLYIRPDISIELLISDQQHTIDIGIDQDDIKNSKISGSKDTELYWQYLRNNQIAEEVVSLQNKLFDSQDLSAKEKDEIEKKIKDEKKKIEGNDLQQLIGKHGNEWFGVFMKGFLPVNIPQELSTGENVAGYQQYLKAHFLDNISFTDPRLWRTVYFPQLIDHYMTGVIEQIPDTVANYASLLVSKSAGDKFCFEQMLSRLVNSSMQSKLMGMENVWAKLAEDYIFDKNNPMITAEQEQEIKNLYEPLKYNRIGMKGQNIRIKDINGDSIDTNSIQATYTILYFYNPTCEHCKQLTPLLRDNIYEKYKDKGVRVVAIDIDMDTDRWKDYVATNKLSDWVNCADPTFKSNYWVYYDVASIPSVYILNKNKKIIARKVDEQNLEKFFEYYLGK